MLERYWHPSPTALRETVSRLDRNPAFELPWSYLGPVRKGFRSRATPKTQTLERLAQRGERCLVSHRAATAARQEASLVKSDP